MATVVGWASFLGLTVLFFFWAYGIVSFLLDLKNRIVPGLRRYRRGRRRQRRRERAEQEREERERELY